MDDGRAVNDSVYCQKRDYMRWHQERVREGGERENEGAQGQKEKVRAQLVLLAGTKRTNTTFLSS